MEDESSGFVVTEALAETVNSVRPERGLHPDVAVALPRSEWLRRHICSGAS